MAAPKLAGLKLYLDSLCAGEKGLGGGQLLTPDVACKYIKGNGFTFNYTGTDSLILTTLGIGVGLPTCVAPIKDLGLQSGKRAFNGGACACKNWPTA